MNWYVLWYLPALTSNEDITFLDGESGGDVNGDVSVSLFVSVVFSDVVEVISSDDDGSVHLGGNDQTPKIKKWMMSK